MCTPISDGPSGRRPYRGSTRDQNPSFEDNWFLWSTWLNPTQSSGCVCTAAIKVRPRLFISSYSRNLASSVSVIRRAPARSLQTRWWNLTSVALHSFPSTLPHHTAALSRRPALRDSSSRRVESMRRSDTTRREISSAGAGSLGSANAARPS